MSIFIWNGNHSFSIGLPLFFYIAQSVVVPTRQAFHHVKFRKPVGFENTGMAKSRQDEDTDAFMLPSNISGYMRPKAEQTDEQRLLYTLLRGYEKSVRPVRNASTPIVVRLGITLTHLFDLDERNQVLTTMIWLDQEWYDELLTWNPADYNGLAVLRTPCELLWLPDIVLYNNADDYTSGYMKSKAMVHSDGNVFWPPPTKLRSTCKVEITFFPFDSQTCTMKFGSWTYNGFQVDVTNRTMEVDLKNYVKNGEWELLKIEVHRNVKYYSCCPEPFVDVTFRIHIRRRVLYYTYNVILPCVMMSALTLLVFLLPPDSGEKIALGVTVLLAFSVFMLAIAEKLPETSDYIPLIGIYLTVVMTMTSISVIMTVIVLNFHWRAAEKYVVPAWIQNWILGKLAYIMCIDTDFNPREKKKLLPPMRLSRHTQASQDDPEFALERSNMLPLQLISSYNNNNNIHENHHESERLVNSSFQDATLLQRRQMFASSNRTTNTISIDEAATGNHVNRRSKIIGGASGVRDRSRNRLQEEIVRALSLLTTRQEVDDNILAVRKQWRQVAQVLDRGLFWIFSVATVSSTFILLVIVPLFGDMGIDEPIENTL